MYSDVYVNLLIRELLDDYDAFVENRTQAYPLWVNVPYFYFAPNEECDWVWSRFAPSTRDTKWCNPLGDPVLARHVLVFRAEQNPECTATDGRMAREFTDSQFLPLRIHPESE